MLTLSDGNTLTKGIISFVVDRHVSCGVKKAYPCSADSASAALVTKRPVVLFTILVEVLTIIGTPRRMRGTCCAANLVGSSECASTVSAFHRQIEALSQARSPSKGHHSPCEGLV